MEEQKVGILTRVGNGFKAVGERIVQMPWKQKLAAVGGAAIGVLGYGLIKLLGDDDESDDYVDAETSEETESDSETETAEE